MTNVYANDSGFQSDLDKSFKFEAHGNPNLPSGVAVRNQVVPLLVQAKIINIPKVQPKKINIPNAQANIIQIPKVRPQLINIPKMQPNIINITKVQPKIVNEPKEVHTPAIDEQSQMGHFGWHETKSDVYLGIPYILRKAEKYFSTLMIGMQPRLNQYRSCLRQDLYIYFTSLFENATEAEARLLNEINRFHCDGKFGPAAFTTKSTLVKASDAYSLFAFLDTCYRKLTCFAQIMSNKIGFLQSTPSNIVVPYVRRNGDLYMPLFCFENINDIDFDFISGWDLAYLRFCCIYQGIWKGSSDICAVVSLSDLTAKLSPSDSFDICWPSRADHGLLLATIIGNIWDNSCGLKYMNLTLKRKRSNEVSGPNNRLPTIGAIQRTNEDQSSKKSRHGRVSK